MNSVEWDKLLVRARIDGFVPATVNGEPENLQATATGDTLEVTVHSRQLVNFDDVHVAFANVATEPTGHVTRGITLYGESLKFKLREVTTEINICKQPSN